VPSARCGLVLVALFVTRAFFVEAALAQDAGHRLQLSDKVDQSNRYRLVFDMRMRADVAGDGELGEQGRRLMEALAEGMTIQTVVEYEQRLIGVASDGVRTFEVRWHDYRFTGKLGDQEVAAPAGYSESLRDLLSQTALIRTTPAGKTIDVTYSHPQLAGLAQKLGQMDGGMPTYLPEKRVAVGDSWRSEVNIPLGMGSGGPEDLTLDMVHTLTDVRQEPGGPIALIELKGSYSQLEGLERSALGTPMHIQASLTGFSIFDIAEGRFAGGEYEIDMFALSSADGIEIQLTGHANGNLELVGAK
jgi:hypothetical protein